MAQVHAVELKGNQQELSPNKRMGCFGWRSSSNKTSTIKPKKNAQVPEEKIKERKQEQAIIVPYFAASARFYNKREDNFASLRDYNDYLEDVIFNLVQGIDVAETEAAGDISVLPRGPPDPARLFTDAPLPEPDTRSGYTPGSGCCMLQQSSNCLTLYGLRHHAVGHQVGGLDKLGKKTLAVMESEAGTLWPDSRVCNEQQAPPQCLFVRHPVSRSRPLAIAGVGRHHLIHHDDFARGRDDNISLASSKCT
ncbi:hypothetical protein SELMODRAFT_404242 [Selaginella moellendorffii]|uniref:MAT1 centre domain-containing protein n=1 Tax=Selaginella moellendorffii TaxID=88036 RepID=D8QUQ6_SELML|nr:hypothetical protein SELMODRAFT_404242 [Selaginella moellendorffii]